MIRIETLVQLKAFARQDALLLALVWTASFACMTIVQAGIIGNLLALATPFVVGWRLTKFRDHALYGYISFRRAFAYCAYVFFYASLVFALVQFAYFRFLDNGAFAKMFADSMQVLAPFYEKNGMSRQDISHTITAVKMITPVEWAFMFMMQNIFIGAVLSLFLALVGKRRKYII